MSRELWENIAKAKQAKKQEVQSTSLTLDDEIEFIQDDMIKYFVKWALTTVPPAFWLVSASKSGDYHPNFTHCEGGLIKHIKYGVRIAVELFKDPVITNFSQEQKDIIKDTISFTADNSRKLEDMRENLKKFYGILID